MHGTIVKDDTGTETRRIALPVDDHSGRPSGALTIQRTLARVDGVAEVYVCPISETRCLAYVELDTSRAGPERLLAAFERAGFEPGRACAR